MSSPLSTYRTRKYRESLKDPANEEKLKDDREKKKISNKKYLVNVALNDVKHAKFKEAAAVRARKYRLKLKMNAEMQSQVSESITDTEVFKSASTKSKALKKAEKALPKKLSQKKEIVKEMARKYQIFPESSPEVPVKKPRKAYVGLPELIKSFYTCDAVSRLRPGRDDVVKMRMSDGSIQEVQKFIMTVTLSEAYEEFRKTFPEKSCSLTYFKSMRPKNVMLKSKHKHFSCLCVYCENLKLLIDSVTPYFKEEKKFSPSDLLDMLLCSKNEFACSNNSCENCHNFMDNFKELLKPCCIDEPVKYQRWEKNPENTYTELFTLRNKKMSDALSDFEESFKFFKLHKFIQNSQKEFLNQTKHKLNPTEAVLIVDYAEKYSTRLQNEVQTAFFGSRSLAVFTAHAKVGQNAEYSFAIISDNTNQTKNEVFPSLKYIISKLKSMHPQLRHVTLFSDGSASQFKNRFQFKNLQHAFEDHQVTIELAFFATGHGKSPCDGIGAAVKRAVRTRVLTGKFQVQCAADFVTCANSFPSRIHVSELTQTNIDSYSAILKTRWEDNPVKTIPGTQKMHSFKLCDDSVKIDAAVTSFGHHSKTFKI
jgi:hypothetical protein